MKSMMWVPGLGKKGSEDIQHMTTQHLESVWEASPVPFSASDSEECLCGSSSPESDLPFPVPSSTLWSSSLDRPGSLVAGKYNRRDTSLSILSQGQRASH